MEKVELILKVNYIYEYTSNFGYSQQDKRKYIFKDELKRAYIWDTTRCLGREISPGAWQVVGQGDTVKLTGFIKRETEYKGDPQIELTRCKLVEILDHFPTREEWEQLKREKQLQSLTENDFLWQMPYRQYKAHYADCESLVGSFKRDPEFGSLITVIIREGRLKPSGTRGKHYHGYVMKNEEGKSTTYRAVSEENAKKQARREFPGHTWECVKIYDYAN